MTFPKKGTRTLHVDGETFHWHISPKRIDYGGVVATIQRVQGGALVHYSLDWFPSPSEAVDIIRFAKAHGWYSHKAGAAVRIGRDATGNLILPNGGDVKE